MIVALLLSAVATATPDAADLRKALDAHRREIETKGTYPLTFTDAELEKVAAGDVAKRRERLQGTDRVLGLVWCPGSMDEVWVALQDPDHWNYVDGFLEEHLPGSSFQNKLVYQRIDLPWPFANRQWVIEVTNNLPLIGATQGKIWERTWHLSPARGAENEQEKAIWAPVNDGGWFMAEASGGALLAYHVRTVIGGAVPDEAVIRWSMSTLNGLLGGLAERSTQVHGHYDAGHTPVRRPDGTAIAPMP